jgi:hypothetical protein
VILDSARAGLKESNHYYVPLIILEFSEYNCKILGIFFGIRGTQEFALYTAPINVKIVWRVLEISASFMNAVS